MLFEEERNKICKFVKNMYDHRLTNSAGGNVSLKVSDDTFLMTPTLASQQYLWDITPDQILVLDKSGNIVEGNGEKTREYNMHMRCYEKNSEITCVIHAHALNSMVFAILGLDIPNITEATQKLGRIRCLPYKKATSMDLANVVGDYVQKDSVVPKVYLLNKHGIISVGTSLEKTYDMIERVEWNAYIVLQAMKINPYVLRDESSEERIY